LVNWPEINEGDGFDATGLHFVQGTDTLGLSFILQFIESRAPVALVMLLLPAFVIVELRQYHGGEQVGLLQIEDLAHGFGLGAGELLSR
jgi:hypothetical protein